MKILRVFNNNVVLSRDESGHEVILTGRGLGFQARPGSDIDESKVVRTFVPKDAAQSDSIAQMLSVLSPEVIAIAVEAMASVGISDRAGGSPSLVLALADHLTHALRRAREGTVVEYPLRGEVEALYLKEYRQARRLLDALNARLDDALPETEAVAFALHLVNAGFAAGDLAQTYTMTGVIEQVLAVVATYYGIELDGSSASVARFITHLRYLFVRIYDGSQLVDEPEPITAAISASYPEAFDCAQRASLVIELRTEAKLTADEIAYLALHIARIAATAA